ncbi:dihydroorotase [Alkalimarinus alittae]|uniref:Dihydroorotase n=1 Tax=Alkalimarinus alittae TaxID=2961619 RepID=A0ABY6N357_9ALTE|nr:dihydroorotase [Alkalimarinus alittae]UZE96545.1 dihydroorotase [Alkalimarinus alittae]
MNIEIKSGRIVDPVNGKDEIQSLYVSEGKIVAIGKAPEGFLADQVVDASGCVVSPGFIDLCAYLREPGYEYKGTVASETFAAAKGGFTAVCCPPQTLPVNDSEAVTHLILDLARRAGFSKVYPIGALTKGLKGQQLSEVYSLKRAGCVGVGNSGRPVADLNVMKRCCEYAKTHDMSVFVRPEDVSLASDGCVHEGAVATRLGLPGIPALAETVAVSQLILLAEETGAHLHMSQLTAAKSVELVADAKKRGIRITADVSAQHLLLTDVSVSGFDSRFHCLPPFRTEADRLALIEGVNSGVIDAICSQHQPHEAAAKQAPFAESEPGISSIETVLPLLLGLERAATLSMDVLIRSLSVGAANVLGVQGGSLAEGQNADICIFDPNKQWVVNDETIKSSGKSTPWKGEELQGLVKATLVDGCIVYA